MFLAQAAVDNSSNPWIIGMAAVILTLLQAIIIVGQRGTNTRITDLKDSLNKRIDDLRDDLHLPAKDGK